MKKITFSIILSVLFILERTYAQPTISAATNNPTVGEMFTQYQIGYEDPGASGANITWDFSGIISLQTLTNTFMLPSATPYASTFLNANLASSVTSSSSTYYYYFIANSTNYSIAGIDIPASSATMPYSDPENMLQYTMTYNTSYTDNFACTVSGYDRHGNISVVADAYGTLNMPYGTVTNVLRLKFSETYADYMSGTAITNYTSTNYYWYKPGVHNCILQLSTLNVNGSVYQQYGMYIDCSNIGVNENTDKQNDIICYPIPAKEILTIETNSDKEQRLEILNLFGQIIYTSNINKKAIVNTFAFANGIYILKLSSNKETVVRKFIIE